VSLTHPASFAPTVMARCPVCGKALGPGNHRTAIEVRLLPDQEEVGDGAIEIECPRSRCRRKLEVRPVLVRAAA